MRSIAYYWKEGLRNIFKHGFMSVAAVVIMVVSLLLTGTVTLVAYNITNNITRLQQSNQIVVWIDDSLTTREAKTLQTQFEKIDNIASIAFEDRDVALEQYRKELGDDADILDDYNADNNPLRNSYVFTLSDSMQADATIKEIEAVDGVAKRACLDGGCYPQADSDSARVQHDRGSYERRSGCYLVFIISNTVKLAMFARREEISIQKMVGATNWFIRAVCHRRYGARSGCRRTGLPRGMGSVHRAVQRGRYGFAVLVPSALVRCAALVGARRVLRCRRVVRHRRFGNEYPQVYGCITTA